jgi:cytochrome P450
MSRIVSMTSGRAFCEELCRNDEWINITIGYTMNVFTGANAMKKYHPWLRPLVYRWVPELATVHSTKKRAVELIQSVLDQRKRAQIELGAAYVKPTDMLQWLEEKMSTWTARTVDVPHITDLELILGFASIHSNTGSLTNILYDLVARPEYMAPLRQEIEEVVFQNHNHQYSRQALDQLWKLDSFMKESMRYTPTNMTMFKRQILKPVTLSDGTFLPVGTFIEIPAAAVARDPDVVPGEISPDVFDGFRYERLRRGVGKEDAAKYLFATIGIDGGMHFGFGRRACPGRFFTTNLMKLILAHIISEYDLKMVEDDESRDVKLVRYENLHVEATNFVDPGRRLLMRMRQ